MCCYFKCISSPRTIVHAFIIITKRNINIQLSISRLLGKLFDIIILKEQSTSLSTDVLQFGFKPHSFTTISTSLLRDTIEYYNEHGSDCYLLLLDASKAFDRVEYVKLFRTLRDRKMCPVVLRLTMKMYINQRIQVKWNSIVSSNCYISNGVKQGGCISPIFFSVYLNGLIEKLRKNNIRCRYDSEFMGVFGYADDLSLLSPSFTGIKEMLRTCEIYADEHKMLKRVNCCILLSLAHLNIHSYL